MTINEPDVLAEVNAVFLIYDTALVTNDVDTLDTLFWNSPHTLRYGGGEDVRLRDSRALSSARSSRPTGATLRRPTRYSGGITRPARSAGKARRGCGRRRGGKS